MFAFLPESTILAIQGHAVVISDTALLATCYRALGYDSRYAFQPTTADERTRATRALIDQLEMMSLMGEVLRVVPGMERAA
mgnify:FL=1